MSSPLTNFYNELILGLKVLEITTYVNLASLTVICYDWALKLYLEIPLVWESRPSLIKYLYIITRYMVFGDVTLMVYEQVAQDLSAKKCTAIFSAFGWMFATGIVLGELILVLRAWAVWGRDSKLGVALLAFYVGMCVAIYVIMGIFLRDIKFMDGFPGISGCAVIGSSDQLWILWVLLMVLDIVVCLLMAIKGRASYVSGGNSQLMKVVYGEGVMYYAYLVALSMVNVIVILRLPREYIALLSTPVRSLHAILTCRVVLHTRKQAKNTVIFGDGETIIDGGLTNLTVETMRFTGVGDEIEDRNAFERNY